MLSILGRSRKTEITTVNGPALTLCIAFLAAGAISTAITQRLAFIVSSGLLGLYFLFAIKVVQQWEKVAVLRLGRYVGLRGPGLVHIVPVIETLSPYIDQRVRVASVTAESTLTRDTVPVTWTRLFSGWCGIRRRRFWKWKTTLRQSL
jgi:SPFH domain/Band 7 family protein